LGWLIGALLSEAIWQVFRSIKLDEALRRAGIESFLKRGGIELDSGAFLGGIVKWFVIVMFLVASLEILGLNQINAILRDIVTTFLPQVISAVLILLAAGVLGDLTGRLVASSAKTAGVHSAHFAGAFARWSIWTSGILIALSQVGIAEVFSQTLFTGIVVAVSLGLGLSFGLGGQAAAAEFIEKLRSEMRGRNGNN
jgi:hypothetical protein